MLSTSFARYPLIYLGICIAALQFTVAQISSPGGDGPVTTSPTTNPQRAYCTLGYTPKYSDSLPQKALCTPNNGKDLACSTCKAGDTDVSRGLVFYYCNECDANTHRVINRDKTYQQVLARSYSRHPAKDPHTGYTIVDGAELVKPGSPKGPSTFRCDWNDTLRSNSIMAVCDQCQLVK